MLSASTEQLRGERMGRSAAIAMLIAVSFTGAPVLAQQAPMSPILRLASSASERPTVVAASPAPAITMPATAVARPDRDDPAVATAVIPPPLAAHPPAAASPKPIVKRQKRPPAQAVPEEAAAQPPVAKHQKRVTSPKRRYTRPHHAPRYARYYGPWNYGYATAAVTGWGGGRFGPSPYSSTGQ
jgi:hypothetical protein